MRDRLAAIVIARISTSLGAVALVFRNPDMRRLQLGWAAMSFALWSFAIALGVYAFDIGGATAVGIAGLVRLLPGALASPFSGLLGDRHSRRAVLVASAAGAAAVLAAAAASVALDAPAGITYALAGLFTVIQSPYVPAEGALLPVVAKTPQELSAANVAHSAMDNGGFLAGSILTGILLATTSAEAAFAVAGSVAALAAFVLAGLSRDARPEYTPDADARGVLHETARGSRDLLADRRLRVIGAALTLLVLFEGAVDVLVVIVALDLLDLEAGSVGFLNAAWGVGALLATVPLTLVLERGRLAGSLVAGCFIAGAAIALPAVWAVPAIAYLAWAGIGAGYDFVEVAARTLMQRLGSDETLARVLGALETSRLCAMAVGSIAAPGLVALFGIEGALLATAAVLPLFALVRWSAIRAFEAGAPVEEGHYTLLRGNEIFAPLPVDTLEGLAHGLVPVTAAAGEEIITEGDRGERFYLIESGEVEVFEGASFKRTEGRGESFGEIALLRDVARTATVLATRETRLLALDRDHFVEAVTGHRRSHEAAAVVAEERLGG